MKIKLAIALGVVVGFVSNVPSKEAWTGAEVALLTAQLLFYGLLFYAIAIAIWQRKRTTLIWAWTGVGAAWDIVRVLSLGAPFLFDIPAGTKQNTCRG